MFSIKIIRSFLAALPLFLLSARAAVVNATWNSVADVPVTAASYTATGNTVNLTLNFAPDVGTNLTVVNNTGLPLIQGTYGNLAQGQKVALTYSGIGYNFVANYYGGTGNDLVLHWADNRVFAWGYNSSGRLGDGTSTSRIVPNAVRSTGVLAGKTILAVSAGADHSLALCSDGTLVAWGDNGDGELGNNSTTDSNVPVQVNQTGGLAGKTVIAVSAGSSFSVVLCADGTVAAWGRGASGQLGNNITASSYVPSLVSTSGALLGKTVVRISAGFSHSLVLCSDGTLVAWGNNSEGQFGNNSTAGSPIPVIVPPFGALTGKNLTDISAGNSYSLACADGQALAWGAVGYGNLGGGASSDSMIPVAVTSTGVLFGKTVIAVAASPTDSHSLALCSDGSVITWGSNSSGQLGSSGSLIVGFGTVPVEVYQSAVFLGKTVTGVRAGAESSIAQFSDGTLAAWGNNNYGQLGINNYTDAYAAVAVESSVLPTGEKFMTGAPGFTAGSEHAMALVAAPPKPKAETAVASSLTSNSATLNGNVNANSNSTTVTFEYGLANSDPFASPASSYSSTVTASQSPLAGNTNTAVSANITGLVAGTTYNYRVKAVNALGTTFGANATFVAASNNANLSGLTLSSGSFTPSFNANTTEYAASVSNTTLTTGIRPTLADTTASVRVNGIVVSSGSSSGAIDLAVGPNIITVEVKAQDATTVKTYSVTVTRLSANADLALLIPSAGTLSPAFAAATTSYTSGVPYSITSLTLTPTVADSTATVRVNGTLVASGSASNPITLNVGTNTFTILVTAQNAATKTYTLVLTRQAFVTTYNAAGDVPVTVNGLTATGNSATVTLNFAPLTGTNLTLVNNTGLAPIVGSFSNLTHGQTLNLSYGGVNYQFVANYYGGTGNDLVLQWANTRLLAWGTNGSGQLGNNAITDSPIPTAVNFTGALAGKSITSVAVGSNHSIALSSDGRIAAWGYNGFGQLGIGTTADSLVPVSVTTTGVLSGKTVIAIAAGQFHNLALCTDGTLAAWGYNFYGQLGNGLTSNSSSPVAVSKTGVLTGKTIIAIAAGTYHSFALCSDGTLAAWGYNGNGELGNGGTGFSPLPVAVDTTGVLVGKTIAAVFAGSFHNFALCTDGTLAGWGYNGYGQLGDNSATSRSVPVLVNGSGVLSGKTITAASAGYYHSLALCADGTVAAWGNNGNGELGDGSNNPSMIPVAVNVGGVLSGKTIASLSSGAVHNIATCTDGTLLSWGYNGDGELGSGGSGSSNVPVTVNSSALLTGEFFAGGWSGSTGLHGLAIVASPPPPIVTTLAASSITATSAVLNGTVNANGSSTAPTFDYGLTTNYGTTIAGTPSQVSGTSSIPVSATVSGLSPGTTYHYRINGTSSGGTTRSANVIFTTSGFNANLSNLVLSSSGLNPVFSSATTGYTASVPSTTTTISVTPTVATPTSTVKVNGTSVVSGTSSTPIFLLPGNNTITVAVTAQDAVTTKTYTISVTRLSPAPEIGVTQSAIAISDGGSKDFGPATAMRPALLTFVIVNTGNSNLTGLGITIDGPNAAQFSLSSLPTTPVSGPGGSTTFTVAFTPAGVGTRSATLHISSNDADENPYDIALSGTGLSSNLDTDGDGLNDAAEFQLETLGFDWQTSQTAMVATYFNNANIGGLYTLNQFQALQVDAPILTKNPTTGLFSLRIGIQKSTNLMSFTPFLMTAPQTTITGDGKMKFEFASPDNAAFYRLLAE
jgi:alpha-tubulin suppressor-like RCC1 family protein